MYCNYILFDIFSFYNALYFATLVLRIGTCEDAFSIEKTVVLIW